MKKHTFLCIFLVLSCNFLLAQKEATHWFFGENAGLDFSSGSPVADLNGSLSTIEGCATISDASGDLLFYTDGTSVWNRIHRKMPHGSGLLGNSSSSQSAIIVPKPGDATIYYIFTIDWAGSDKGLNYYTVDTTLDGGLGDLESIGDVPTVINLLSTPTSEKITVVNVLDEDTFWVISFKQGRFYVFKVDANGVNDVAVLGNTGFLGSEDPRGYLKVSPEGTKLVSANMTKGIFIYDFNSVSGIITNERKLDTADNFPYGVEFSPQGRKLYVSTGDASSIMEHLYQFTVDIAEPTITNLNATRVELHSYFNARAALQLGLDGKIYRAVDESNFLGVINNPEEDGLAANYVHNGVSLGDKVSKQGLPQFIQSFFSALIQTRNTCIGEPTSFTIRSNKPILAIVWNFGDGSPTSTLLNPMHTYTASGDYTVTVQITTEDGPETVVQTISIFNFPDVSSPITLQQCDDDTDGITFFNLREAENLLTSDDPSPTFTYHLTMADADANSAPITNLTSFSNATANQVFVRVENRFGCHRVAEVNLQVSTTAIPANFMFNLRACDTDEIDNDDRNGITTFNFSSATNAIVNLFPANQNLRVTYFTTIADALAEVNALDAINYRNVRSPFTQQIVVRVDSERNNACLGLGFHVTLTVDPLPEFEVSDPQYLCLNQLPQPLTLTVENPQGNYTYELRDQNGILISTSTTIPQFNVTSVGDYFVTATTVNNCTKTKKITVEASNIATVQDIQTIDIFDDLGENSITIIVTGEGVYEFALDDVTGPYQDSNILENVGAGTHIIYIRDKNGCGIVSEQVSIVGFPRFFTPNGDGFNDTWQVLGIGSQLTTQIYIFDRFGKIITKINPSSEGWNGTYRGLKMPSNDYWFRVELEDGRLRRGHFSLIRR